MVLNFAHRGYSAKYPEDTMLAFEKAIRVSGCNGITIDVQMTKDGEIVIIHDITLDRTCNNMKGSIRSYTLEQLKDADVSGKWLEKYGPQPIPTLREYLEFIKPLGKKTIIEIKSEVFEYKGIEAKIIELVKEFDMIGQVMIASCNHYSILRIKELCPEVQCGLMAHSWLLDAGNYVKNAGCECYLPNFSQNTPENVKRIHEAGVEIHTWVCNSEVDIERSITAGVDGIIGDDPEDITKFRRIAEIESEYPLGMAVCGWAD